MPASVLSPHCSLGVLALTDLMEGAEIRFEHEWRLFGALRETSAFPCSDLQGCCRTCNLDFSGLDLRGTVAKVEVVQVVLRKLGRGSRAVSGRLVRAPRKGSVIVIEFADGMHEYVTTAVKRVLSMAQKDVFYIETVNSRYRLEVQEREDVVDDASSG